MTGEHGGTQLKEERENHRKKEGEDQTIVMGGESREQEAVGSHFLVYFLKSPIKK